MNKTFYLRPASFLLLSFCLLLLSGCSQNTPKRVVQEELDLIRQVDGDTIPPFISYSNMISSQSRSKNVDEKSAEAVELFFKNFSYKIGSCEIKDKKAVVNVEINNLDTKALAQDLCRLILAQNISSEQTPDRSMESTPYFVLLYNCLSQNKYDIQQKSVQITLHNVDDNWEIAATEELEDALVSGFVSSLKDPDLLSPEEVLSIYMECFQSMTPEEWVKYLDMEDIFATGNPLFSQIDLALAEQLSKCFHASVKETSKKNDTAEVQVEITSLDLENILTNYSDLLMEYANTTASIRASDSELSDKTSEYLLQAIRENELSVTKTVTIPMTNNGSTWVMQANDSFTDAVLGDPANAVQSFIDSAQSESEEPTVLESN